MSYSAVSRESPELVKENVSERAPLRLRWLAAALAAGALAALALGAWTERLPAPRDRSARPDTFIAEIAHEHLVNLTSIGPRVAGSYENEVAAVRVLVAALRDIAAGAAPHHRVEVDVRPASGAFSLSFLDGMNNVYRDVQVVVARLTARGGRPTPAALRSALLINCHFDTVPDSPGASDDGAGCAVGLETLRALAAADSPHAHDVILLLNGAEENIMQGSHAFVTSHPWAPAARAFINVEACGAGGREVLFQAGPRDPWIMELYAQRVPHPFASSLAQELFESGIIPADTDFRVFRDFGNLSGVDLAWSSNGYVYHTSLDTAERAPPAALQRTGDNVLALAQGMLSSGRLAQSPEPGTGQPVFFDVLGLGLVCVRAPAAAAAAALAAAAVAARLQLHANAAKRELYLPRSAWWRLVGAELARCAAGALAGVGWSAAAGALLHACGARMAFYSRPWLVVPLYVAPAFAVSWSVTGWLGARRGWAGVVRGWWRARLAGDAAAAGWALLLLACAAAALRSGFLAALWAGALGAAGAARAAGASGGTELGAWVACAALPALQTGYVALDVLAMFVPMTGRAGPAPHDAAVGALAAALALAAGSALLPLAATARRPGRLAAALLAAHGAALLWVALRGPGAAYSATRPQRALVFHTRRTDHVANSSEALFWMPDFDSNTPRALAPYVPMLRSAVGTTPEACARWVYCGAPYYLPGLGFIPTGHEAPAPEPPLTRLEASWSLIANGSFAELELRLSGPAHVVCIVAPVPGARVVRYRAGGAGSGTPREAHPWGDRRTYFFALHDARQPAPWSLTLWLERQDNKEGYWADLSLAGHSLFGPNKTAPALAALLRSMPPHAAPAASGWGVDLHLVRV